MVIIGADGVLALKYRKMIPWCPKEPWTPGDEMPVCDGPKGSRLAMALCADFDYPEIAREAAWKGANVILRPSKYMYPWDHIWDITNQVRAYENIAYVVAVNHTGHDNSYTYFGRSMAVDFDGNIICRMGDSEGMTKVDLYPNIRRGAPARPHVEQLSVSVETPRLHRSAAIGPYQQPVYRLSRLGPHPRTLELPAESGGGASSPKQPCRPDRSGQSHG